MKDLMRKMNRHDRITITQIRSLFQEVDKAAERFKGLTGIRCPDGCGVCCAKARVETTAIEMLPLAVDLWSKDKADIWLQKIDSAKYEGLCVFFKQASGVSVNGRCSVYELRPLICRLFGFFTVRDKHGRYVYGSCRVIKESYYESYQKAARLIAEGFHPSNMTDFTIRIVSMGSDLGRKTIPINTAARIALEKVGFELVKKQWSNPKGETG